MTTAPAKVGRDTVGHKADIMNGFAPPARERGFPYANYSSVRVRGKS